MRAPNHIAGGLVFTGICSSLSGVNVFASPVYLGLAISASLLPDIDHPKTLIGSLLKPISVTINRRYGHRTITHSGVTLTILTLILAIIEKLAAGSNSLSLVFFFAYFSHLMLDMMTLQGVPLLYPITKNPFVIPGNPAYRIRTGDLRAEAVMFCLFLSMGLFLRPLFEHGFWTSYNRLFGTMKHLHLEFQRSEDLLEVEYRVHKGSLQLSGKGYCLEAKPTRTVLLQADSLLVLDQSELVVEEVIPSHTGQQFFFREHHFVGISIDSLQKLVSRHIIAKLDIAADRPFLITANGVTSEQRHFESAFLLKPLFHELHDSIEAEVFVYELNPRIPVLRQQLRNLQQENLHRTEATAYRYRQITNLKTKLQKATNLIIKERLYHQLETEQKQKLPLPDYNKEAILQTEISALLEQEHARNARQREATERRNREALIQPTTFTGYLTTVEIEGL
ncbi:MAG: metal-dependent hydrolase [Lewinellaceae bacterium]|nr:metal-dependent hydrolase [Lewinellaceae bacterium]